ncbi:type III restriction-modification enzyme helicase subunit [Bartonella tribocorum]|nr:type III restriction-modification enzyme helicase subunit [Bartonella tribocorum]
MKPCPSFLIIDYQEGHIYEPDFIVETEKAIYLCEIKRASYKRDVSLYSLRYNLFVV